MSMPPIHPAAILFPMMGKDELRALADDIKAHGLQQPIVMLGAQLLDGRNRWLACEMAGVEPRVRDWSGDDPIAYVVSLNLTRRHLDESQRAMVAARIATMRKGARTDLVEISTKSQSAAADLLNVSRESVVSARKVIDRGTPELAAAVDAGDVAVSAAAQLVDRPVEVQRAVVASVQSGESKNVRQAIQKINAADKRIVTLDEAVKGRFPVIYADPPWRYSNTGFEGSAETHYPTMTTDDICDMPVADKTTTNAVLFLWATWPLLDDALRVMARWGFEYKTGAPWKKNVHVGGFYFLGITELLLVGVRGSSLPRQSPVGFFDFPRGQHSKKPAEIYDVIERMYDGPYLELFARATRDGWASFGNEHNPGGNDE